MSAALLRSLHLPGRPLILPNVWDAASARLVEQAGFPVVATGSAAVAESLGYGDHQEAPPEEMFAAARRIARVVSVPVTVDAEGGYGLSAEELAERLADAGAVGCNIEDTNHTGGGFSGIAEQADKLAALRAAAPDLVINARVDMFLQAPDQDAVLDEAIERARAYRQAGADCIYPILVRSAGILKAFVDAVGPVNAALFPGGPDLSTMEGIGVARISLGPGPWRLAQASTRRLLRALAAGISPYED
jgi:2-methylisocitrate lyase-like PEP mutase family enzyme